MTDSTTHKTFKYRLYPTDTQKCRLQHFMDICRAWYNMCLSERKLGWEFEKRHVAKSQQCKNIKLYRRSVPLASDVPVTLLETICNDLQEAFDAFFRRVKAGEKPGYPKFKGWKFFNSFGTHNAKSFKPDGRAIYLQNVGRIKVLWHRPYEGEIKTARFIREAGNKWFVCLTCELPVSKPLPETGNSIGVDFGINALMTFSDGTRIENPKWYRDAQNELRLLQRKFARAVKGSNNWKDLKLQVQRLQWHVANQRKDFWDKLIFSLTSKYDLIALEDLQVNNMVKNKHLSKSILDASWGYARKRLEEKALETGAKIILVNPAYTSKTCSTCGHEFENFTLSTRWVNCRHCGLSLDRDHNAALNVLKRAGHARSSIT
jgi:putative transposase